MNRKLSLLSGIVIFLSIFYSCDKNRVYDQVYSLPGEGWNEDSIMHFNFAVTDTSRAYDILIHVRNGGNYQYSNLWLFIRTTAPGGNFLRDTLEIPLADPSGRWLGKGLGDINAMLVPYKTNVLFPHRGLYSITIQQAMRQVSLKNILDIGVRLQYHEILEK